MVYCFDIDGTLCNQVSEDYLRAKPMPERIDKVNELYRAGHTIKLFTSRGSVSGMDWEQQTRSQLESWGLLFHELILGKPHADVYVDDKSVNPDDFIWEDH